MGGVGLVKYIISPANADRVCPVRGHMPELTLLVGGPGSGKTDQVISRLAARYEADPFSEAIVLVPTVRHGDQFRRRLVGRCGVALRLRVETIAQFSRTLASDARVPSHSLAEELLQRTIRLGIESGSAAYFKPVVGTKGLGNLLGGAIGDLLAEGVDPEALSEAAERSGSRSLQALGAIYKEYRSGLRQGHWTHPMQIGAAAADVVEAGADLPGTIMLDGFHLFRETEMDLLEALAGKTAVVVTLDPSAGVRAEHDYERLCRRFPNAKVLELECDVASPTNVVAGDAADREGQLRAIARQIKQRLTDEPSLRPSDFAVAFRQVTPHLGLARQVFSEYDLPLDPAAGEPLSARPLGAWLRRLMHLARDGWHLRDVVAVLSSGFVDLRRWRLSRENVAALARRGRQNNLWAGLDALGRAVEGLRSGGDDPEKSDRARQRLGGIASGMSAALEDLRALLERSSGTTAEHARHFDEALFGVQALVDPRSRAQPGVDVELDALRGQLQDLIHTHEVLGGGLETIEVFMARLEAKFDAATVLLREPGGVLLAPMHTLHGLRFDFVAVGGLVEGEFPAPRGYHSLLDSDAMDELNRWGLGIPPAARLSEDELWASVSTRADRTLSLWKTRLNERGRPVSASYYYGKLQPDECIEAGMSMPEEATSARELAIACTWQWPSHGRLRPRGESAWPIVRSAVAVEQRRRSYSSAGQYEGRLTDGLVPGLTDAGATWSASRIESYKTCSFQFFGHYALGLREIEQEMEGADAAIRGTVVHEILQDAIAPLVEQGRPLVPETLPEVLERLRAKGPEIWVSAPAKRGFGRAALWRLDAEETLEKIELLLGREADWSARSGVTRIIGAEKKIDASLPLDPPLRVTATIDRLEEGEGRVVIVDYKSGRQIPRSHAEEGRRVQLQLYGYAGRDETRAGRVIARYAWLDPAIREWEIDSSREEDALLLEEVVTVARDVRDAVDSGDFRVNPKVTPCPSYCSFRHVCRVNGFSRWKSWD